jgi:4-carboxymuconolactone decarboxylase
VKSKFGERGVMDLVGAVGYYSLVSMVLNVAQVPLPPGETPPLKPL